MKVINKIIIVICILLISLVIGCKKTNIEVNNDSNNETIVTVSAIKVSDKSILNFNQGEFDLSKIYITVSYSDNTTKEIQVTKEMVKTNIDNINNELSKDIEIEYDNKTCTAHITLNKVIKVEKVEVLDISVLEFNQGEFDPTSILFDAYYNDGTILLVELSMDMIISNKDKLNEVGTHTITVKYENLSFDITITINEIVEKQVVDISLNKYAKTSFTEGEVDLKQIKLDVKYNDDSVSVISVTEEMISTNKDELNEEGIYEVIVTYSDISIFVYLEITPVIDTDNYLFESLPYNEGYMVTGYMGDETHLIIPSTYQDMPVVSIGEKAFYNNSFITRVTIPNTVTSIGSAAFYKASSLTSVVVPNSVEIIEEYALRDVKVIYLEGTIKETYSDKWYDEQHTYIQENVDISSITFDGYYEFFTKNEKIVLSNYLGSESKINVPSSYFGAYVEIIGGACFMNNLDLVEVTLPNTVKELEKYAFAGCTNITKLELSNSLEIIGEYAIRGCESIEYITLPESLIEIRNSAFNMCSNLKEMIIPKNVTSVGVYAFSWCVNITKIYIPKSVITMQSGACYSCSKATIYLESNEIPSTWETGWNMSNRKVLCGQTLE